MNEPWFDGNLVGGALGAISGTLAGLWGAASGYFIPRGKGKVFVYGTGIFLFSLGAAQLLAGIVAVGIGQPRSVFYPLLLSGSISTFVLGPLLWVTRQSYSQVEQRKMLATDLG